MYFELSADTDRGMPLGSRSPTLCKRSIPAMVITGFLSTERPKYVFENDSEVIFSTAQGLSVLLKLSLLLGR